MLLLDHCSDINMVFYDLQFYFVLPFVVLTTFQRYLHKKQTVYLAHCTDLATGTDISQIHPTRKQCDVAILWTY